ncbi:MAG: hypothetical protein ACKOF9_11530 [Burkholderiales bacterium]
MIFEGLIAGLSAALLARIKQPKQLFGESKLLPWISEEASQLGFLEDDPHAHQYPCF